VSTALGAGRAAPRRLHNVGEQGGYDLVLVAQPGAPRVELDLGEGTGRGAQRFFRCVECHLPATHERVEVEDAGFLRLLT
jgi:hypothetical protein